MDKRLKDKAEKIKAEKNRVERGKPIRVALVVGEEVQYDERGEIIYIPEKSAFIDELIDWHLERLEKISKVKFRPYYLLEDNDAD